MRYWMILCLMTPMSCWANDEVTGYWVSSESIIHVTRQSDTLSSRVFALLNPTYLEDEEFGPTGSPRRDDQNPDAALRSRPLMGMELLSDYKHNGKRWQGKIYDPESGNTYSSRMEVDKHGDLRMRGYIGVPMLGRTAVFKPLAICNENMRRILQASNTQTEVCGP